MAKCILVVDDELDVITILDFNMQKAGYETRCALTGEAALEQAFLHPPPDLIILDIMLPDISGLEVCRQIRGNHATQNVPILMLTARGEEFDRVVGFESGADDYVVKPFSIREVLLRIGAILRRPTSHVESSTGYVCGPLQLDQLAHDVRVAGELVDLSPLEFKLLHTLLAEKGMVLSRASLLSVVWAGQLDVKARTVDTCVNRLREKLAVAGVYIETVRGLGYRINCPLEDRG